MNSGSDMSRVSTASSGTELLIHRGDPSCLTMLGNLYQKLEPQMTKSYRPHVVYVPPSHPQTPQEESSRQQVKMETLQRRKAKLRAATILISTVGEIQRKSEEVAKPDRQPDKQSDMKKGVSLPNLTNSNSDS